MQNTSKQTIYAIRASAHHSALAALQPVSLPKKKTYLSKDMAVATILP